MAFKSSYMFFLYQCGCVSVNAVCFPLWISLRIKKYIMKALFCEAVKSTDDHAFFDL